MTSSSNLILTEQEVAKRELARRGIAYSEETFLRHVRSGNAEVVTLFLDAGVSPDATLYGKSALAVAANRGHEEITKMLLDAGADPMGIVKGLKLERERRSGWDKLSSLTGVFTFISSLLIAAVGWYFTNSYNQRQLEFQQAQADQDSATKTYQNRLVEMQTLEKMIPHLTKDESSKRVALIAISALASSDLAARIGELYGGQGSIDALEQLAVSNTEQRAAPAISALTNLAAREKGNETRPAHVALARALEGREQAIVKLLAGGNPICNGFVVDGRRGWIVTPGYCLKDQFVNGKTINVEFGNTSRSDVTETKFSNNRLLAFIRIKGEQLPALQLAEKQTAVGGSVTQFVFGLGDANANRLSVVLGKVLESGDMSFPDFDGGDHVVSGFVVKLEAGGQRLQGTAGGPLLNSEGKVACMTFMSRPPDHEQCIAASVIADSYDAIDSG